MNVSVWGILALLIAGAALGMVIMAMLARSDVRRAYRHAQQVESASIIRVERARVELYNISRQLYRTGHIGDTGRGNAIRAVADTLSTTTPESEATK
jgi:hypothetical protein